MCVIVVSSIIIAGDVKLQTAKAVIVLILLPTFIKLYLIMIILSSLVVIAYY